MSNTDVVLLHHFLLNGGYEILISKAPKHIGRWPLSKTEQFKEAVYAANLAYGRLRLKGNTRDFLSKAEAVAAFYGVSDAD